MSKGSSTSPAAPSSAGASTAGPRRKRRRLPMKLLIPLIAAQATKPVIGGQAVVEGVMMRSPRSFAIAVRRPDGRIVVREEGWLSFAERLPFLKWPLLRGAAMLVESMYNGMSALNFSASQAMEGEAEEAANDSDAAKTSENVDATAAPKASEPSAAASAATTAEVAEEEGGGAALWFTLITGMLLAVGLFKFAPHFATLGLGMLLGTEGQTALPMSGIGFHLVDGGIKLSIFVGYIGLISLMPDVKRLFMYHGAEHMSVHTFEAEAPLDVDNTRERSTKHPRCGTSLILLVIATSVVMFALILPLFDPLFSRVSDSESIKALLGFAVKIPLLLPIAGVAYEAQRMAAKYPNNLLVKFFISPGMLMQRLTTRQPTDAELEVALSALRKAVWRERITREAEDGGNVIALPKRSEREIEVFDDFSAVAANVA